MAIKHNSLEDYRNPATLSGKLKTAFIDIPMYSKHLGSGHLETVL